ncbi:MAG: SH3 domain-containing protein [Clostridiales bacterium]|nr:SH3 domain-containing protein [Candidatus Cacconaster stercorequi]
MKHLSRKLLVALLAVAVIISVCAVSVFAGQQAIGVGSVSGKTARIRSGSDLSSPVAATLDQGTVVSVLGKSGAWYRVNYDSTVGYIAENCINYVTSASGLKTTGRVLGDTAVIRSAPALSAGKISSVDGGMVLDITAFEDGWYQVSFDGQVGYIRSDSLTLNGKPAPVSPVQKTAPAKAETKQEAAKKPTTAKAQSINAVGKTGVITADDVRLRSAMNATADNVITALQKGDLVTILKQLDGWYKVSYDIHEGYVSSDFVSVDASAVKNTQKAAKAKKTAAKTEKKSEFNSDTSVLAVGLVTTDGVRMRTKANTDCDIIASLSEGTAVSILKEINGWYKVAYDGSTGYISADYLEAKSSADGLTTYGLVNADGLNLRDDASASADVITSLPIGEYVDVTGFAHGWYAVSYDDCEGYVSGDYIGLTDTKPEPEPKVVDEPQDVEDTQSNDSGSSHSAKKNRSLPSGESAGSGSGSGSDIADYALNYQGVPYVYGGASSSGFDCSGFVMYVYDHFGYDLPHGATPQLNYGSAVSQGDLSSGDIVFFQNTCEGDPDPASHVGIYIGGGEFVHASSGGGCVMVSDLGDGYYSEHYLTARHLG